MEGDRRNSRLCLQTFHSIPEGADRSPLALHDCKCQSQVITYGHTSSKIMLPDARLEFNECQVRPPFIHTVHASQLQNKFASLFDPGIGSLNILWGSGRFFWMFNQMENAVKIRCQHKPVPITVERSQSQLCPATNDKLRTSFRSGEFLLQLLQYPICRQPSGSACGDLG